MIAAQQTVITWTDVCFQALQRLNVTVEFSSSELLPVKICIIWKKSHSNCQASEGLILILQNRVRPRTALLLTNYGFVATIQLDHRSCFPPQPCYSDKMRDFRHDRRDRFEINSAVKGNGTECGCFLTLTATHNMSRLQCSHIHAAESTEWRHADVSSCVLLLLQFLRKCLTFWETCWLT